MKTTSKVIMLQLEEHIPIISEEAVSRPLQSGASNKWSMSAMCSNELWVGGKVRVLDQLVDRWGDMQESD